MTKLTARRFGSRWRVTGRSAVSGSNSRELLDGERVRQPAPLVVRADPHPDVGVAALVAAARAGDAAEWDRGAVSPKRQRFRQRERFRDGSSSRVSVAAGDVGAGAVGVHGDVRHLAAST